MTEDTVTKSASPTVEQETAGTTWRRRGIFAAAWAAVAAIVAKQSEQAVQADGTQGTPMTIGALNTETVATHLKWVGNPQSTVLLLANDTGFTPTQADFPAALGGWASGSSGVAKVPHGVYGFTSDASGNGVVGVSVQGAGAGVYGFTNAGAGVRGQTFGTGFGVSGEIPVGTTQNASAVYGSNSSSYAGPGPGAGGFGVFGLSAKGHGVVGVTGAVGAAGIIGTTNGAPGVYAGIFFGPVIVSGAFTVFGPKSAAVPHPDGTHRLLYCVESPESWFEDFGKGQLDCGQAEVAIDPNFAAIANMEDYHVFLTEYGQHNDVYVTQQTPQGFRVKAKNDEGSGTFSWRIVAKRKDIVGERLAPVTLPPEPVMPTPPSTLDGSGIPVDSRQVPFRRRVG
jgi:hypothetical protein